MRTAFLILILTLSFFSQAREVSLSIQESKVFPQLLQSYQKKAYPIFAKYCAGCHNANTPGMNWLDFWDATVNKSVIYNRVYQEGSMPWRLQMNRKDKEQLKSWLMQDDY